MRGALAAAVVLVAVLVPAGQATAAPASPSPSPAPASSSNPLAQYQQLSSQAEVLNEQYLSAQNDYNNKIGQEKQAEAAVATAKQAEDQAQGVIDQFRGQADRVAAASFESGNMNSVSALFTGESASDYLERESLLLDVASDSSTVLDTLQAAYDKAASSVATAQKEQKVLQDAANAANALLTQKQQALAALNAQLSQVELAFAKLSPGDKAEITNTGVQGNWIAPGVRGEAMMYALTRRGDWYVWGAAGPSTFDCSGLVVWSYAQLGISLPHSAAALQRMGTAVSRANLTPGDLVFFGSPAHHVGIYVGKDSAGNDLMVNAPTSGEVVRVQTLNSDYSNARRLNY